MKDELNFEQKLDVTILKLEIVKELGRPSENPETESFLKNYEGLKDMPFLCAFCEDTSSPSRGQWCGDCAVDEICDIYLVHRYEMVSKYLKMIKEHHPEYVKVKR